MQVVRSLLAFHFPGQQGSKNVLDGSNHYQVEDLHCPGEPTQARQTQKFREDNDFRVRTVLRGLD